MRRSLRPRLPLLAIFIALQLLSFAGSGQVSKRVEGLKERGVRFQPVEMLKKVPASSAMELRWKDALKSAQVLQLDRAAAQLYRSEAPTYISLELPKGSDNMILDLVRTAIGPDDLKVILASGNSEAYVPGVHYRGMVRGVPGSWAAISVFDDEVMGLLSTGTEELVLGRFEDDRSGLHVLYSTRELRKLMPFECATEDTGEPYSRDELTVSASDRTTRCVRYYWEVDHPIFLNKGSVLNTTNYVTGLFNQSSILFDNDGIDVTLSEVFVWDVPSPYTGADSGEQLDLFGDYRTSFNGDMAHLLGFGGGGGIAYRNTLCNSQSRFRMAYSGINSSYSNVPTYSWSVEVVTHEQGHNLGSRHTHACSWNGDGTAIDGCGPAAGYVEGSCPNGPVPTSAVGGTIMSYCHLVSAGIRFQNGFGPQPTAVIVNAVNGASCLGVCGTSCDTPGGLTVFGLNANGGTLSWSSVGASSYTLRWRETGGGAWTTVPDLTGNTYALTGLNPGTEYEFQVFSTCDTQSSAYSGSYVFTTPVPCPDTLEPNNSLGTAAVVVLPASVSALIASTSDVDYYQFSLASNSTISISLSGLAGDYDMRLLDNTGAQLAISQAGGTASEFISFPNAIAGNYYVHVYGYSGAFSAIQCYALNVNRFATQGCEAPDQVSVSNETYNSGTVSWSSVGGAFAYDVRWSPAGQNTWTVDAGEAGPSLVINGLQASASYDVQVRSVCEGAGQGGSTSGYTGSVNLTTIAAPCEVAPPILLDLSVILDGPYAPGLQLMADSLRRNGFLPLTEPYTGLGYNLTGTVSTTTGVLDVAGSNAIVDWVLVELRSSTDPSVILEARAALLQRDGDIVAVDGTSALGLCSNAGTYHIAVRHRNHLGIMTANAIPLGPSATTLDMSAPGTAVYGTLARRGLGTVSTMWSSNTTGTLEGATPGVTDVKYTGAMNDRDPILVAIGGNVATNVISGYHLEDCNMDGRVKYTGSNNDRDAILVNIGGSVATNTVVEQLP